MTAANDADIFGIRAGMADDEIVERAQRAERAMRRLLPQMNTLAKAVTRDPSVRVEVGRLGPCTDGKVIYMRPPAELGDNTPHNRSLCGKRDPRFVLECPACRIVEGVFSSLGHEISHITSDSFRPMDDADKQTLLRRAVEARGINDTDETRIGKLKARLESYGASRNYISASKAISPWFPMLVNALEDARVNRELFQARPGIKISFDAHVNEVFDEGVEMPDGSRKTWADQPMNPQVLVALFAKASGYDYRGWFAPEIEELLDDPEIGKLVEGIASSRSAATVYAKAFPLLEKLRERGYCKHETDPEDDPEPEPEPQGDDTDQDQDFEKPERDEDEPGESSGEEADDDDTDDDDEDPADGGDDDDQDGESVSDDDDDQDGEDTEQGEDAGEGDQGDDDDDSEQGDDSADAEGDDDSDEHGNTGDADDEDGDEDPGDEGDGDGDTEDSDTGDGMSAGKTEQGDSDSDDWQESDDAEGGADDDADDSDSDAPTTDEDGDRGDDASDADEDASGDPGDPYGDDDDDEADGSDDTNHGDQDGDPFDDDDPYGDDDDEDGDGDEWGDDDEDGNDDSSTGGSHGGNGVDFGSPEDGESLLKKFGDHENKPLTMDEQKLENEIDRAVEQGRWFDRASRTVFTVNVHREGQDIIESNGRRRHNRTESLAWRYVPDAGTQGMLGFDAEPESQVVAPAMLRARIAFGNNARASMERNLKGGKINTRVLGRRVATQDPRLFQKKNVPGKRDYFVVLGVDNSGSTSGDGAVNLRIEKKAVMQMAEVLNRLGIKFAVFAHNGHYHNMLDMEAGRRSGLWDLDIVEIKAPHEPWAEQQKSRLRRLTPGGCNLDGHAMEFYRKVCQQQRATDKVIMYFTDGQMPAMNFEDELAVLQDEIRMAPVHKVQIVGVGIGTDSPKQHGLDTIQLDEVGDVPRVVAELERRLA